MNKIFITSDTHFNHLNILKYENQTRPFNSIEEMNETIIQNWNNTVSNEDIIYVVGDFFMGPLDKIEPILNRLNGKIILIRGNHDTKNRLEFFKSHGIEVKDIEYISYKGKFFILCHFPIENENFFNLIADNKEIIFCYGHIHSKAPKGFVNNTYHIGLDTNNLTPVSIEDIWNESEKEISSLVEEKIIDKKDYSIILRWKENPLISCEVFVNHYKNKPKLITTINFAIKDKEVIAFGDDCLGIAKCHPKDKDMKNSKTGINISLYRALINLWENCVNQKLTPKKERLIETSKHVSNFNIEKSLNRIEKSIDELNVIINDEKKELEKYIKNKEELYTIIRKNRELKNKKDKKQ